MCVFCSLRSPCSPSTRPCWPPKLCGDGPERAGDVGRSAKSRNPGKRKIVMCRAEAVPSDAKQHQAASSRAEQCQAAPSRVTQCQAAPSSTKQHQHQLLPNNTKRHQAAPSSTKQQHACRLPPHTGLHRKPLQRESISLCLPRLASSAWWSGSGSCSLLHGGRGLVLVYFHLVVGVRSCSLSPGWSGSGSCSLLHGGRGLVLVHSCLVVGFRSCSLLLGGWGRILVHSCTVVRVLLTLGWWSGSCSLSLGGRGLALVHSCLCLGSDSCCVHECLNICLFLLIRPSLPRFRSHRCERWVGRPQQQPQPSARTAPQSRVQRARRQRQRR